MGAWGPAIFSDDTANDVRSTYKEEIANDVPGQEATKIVLSKFADALRDPDDGAVVWLALAATQWKLGRLENEVKARALEIIDNGIGLDLWADEGPQLLKKRKAALQKLRDELISPQPEIKKVKKPFCPPIYLDLKVGDAISYQMESGNYVIFQCVEIKLDRLYGAFPKFLALNWTGPTLPTQSKIRLLPYAKEKRKGTDAFLIWAHKKKDFPTDRVNLVAQGLNKKRPHNPYIFWGMRWSNIDEDILKYFDLKPDNPGWLSRLFKR